MQSSNDFLGPFERTFVLSREHILLGQSLERTLSVTVHLIVHGSSAFLVVHLRMVHLKMVHLKTVHFKCK